ncbi:MAG: PilN domain-containing protein [Nitrospirae bacterium]|nr:PilN domain-containing protein [Nitrospirota bacterium]MBI3594537.1 PilN domain-containing protein [Nitrospirota bacterium]
MRIIGLELDGEKIRFSEFEVSWKGSLQLRSCDEGELAEFEKSGNLRRIIARADQIIVSYPGTLVSARLLSLPFVQQKKIEQVLPFEMEPLLPFELDRVILSYHLLSQENGSSRMMVAVTLKEQFSGFINKLHRYGIDPHQLEWDGMALFNFCRVAMKREKESVLLIKIGFDQTTLCIVKEDAPVMIRAIGIGLQGLSEKGSWKRDHPLINEFLKTMQVFRSEGGDTLQALFVCGEGGEIQGLPDWISSELSIRLERKVSFDGKEIDPRFVPAIGLALKGTPLKGTLSQINFRKEEFSHATVEKGKKGTQRTIFVFSLIIILLGWIDLGIHFSVKKNHYDTVSRLLQKEYRDLFPGKGPIVNEMEQARGGFSELKKRELFFNMPGSTSLEILREITVQIPKEIRIEVNEISVDSEKVRLEGETDSFEALEKIKESLGKSGFFGERIITDSKMNAEESKVKFKLEMNRMAKEEPR